MKKMPLVDALQQFVKEGPLSFHVPGHKNGKHSFIHELGLPNLLHFDVTELNGLDDLHYPSEVIKEAEELLSTTYGSNESYFLVNGSTVGNLASILALCAENDEVIVQRNCHKSVFHGLSLAGAKPIFLPLDIDKKLGQPLGVNIDQAIIIIKKYPNAKAVILTNPNYYGMSQELDRLIHVAHTMSIPVMIDEAHGAHFTVGEPFPKDALSMGADIVIQSAHKTLPAMTMGSYLHIKSTIICSNKIKEMLRILQSSSPSYPIMASLDYSRSFVENFTSEKVNELKRQIQAFTNLFQELPTLQIVETNNLLYKQDLLKLILKSTKGHTGKQLQAIFEQEGVYVELSDWAHVLLILPLDEKWNYGEYFNRIKNVSKKLTKIDQKLLTTTVPNIHSSVVHSYASLKRMQKTIIDLIDATGKIAAENIVPYPPGIPILLQGETITKEHIEYIVEIHRYGLTIHNLIEQEESLQIEVYI